MTPRLLRSNAGFTYLAALALVVVLGIAVSGAYQPWQMQMRREREEELIFRLSQYRTAIRRWYKVDSVAPGAVSAPPPLTDLKHLLKDPNNPQTVRYLRKLYTDPVNKDPATGKEKDFVPIKDANQRIVGVKSESELEPLKKGNLPDEFIDYEDKKKYSEWELNFTLPPRTRATGGGASNLKTTGQGGEQPGSGKWTPPTGVPGWGR